MNTDTKNFGVIAILAIITIGVAFVVGFLVGGKSDENINTVDTVDTATVIGNNQGSSSSITSPSGKLTIDNLIQNQNVSLPMIVTGTVQGWFFEGSFPVILKDANGNQLAVALASTPVDWMTANPIPFTVSLPAVNYTGQGTIVFKKDNPSGEPQFDDEFIVNVVF